MPKDDLVDDEDEAPKKGDNSLPSKDLVKVIEHVERLLEERSNLNADIRAAMDAAKDKGFDKRALKEMIKLRALDATERQEREELRDLYLHAIGLA